MTQPGRGESGSDRAARVAVIIPFFQRKPGPLRRAIESALAQREAVLGDLLIVDDGSPVRALEEIGDLVEAAPGLIRVIEQENAGPGAARNAGLDQVGSAARYVAFLDSDNVWGENHLANACDALETGADFYFADARREWETSTAFSGSRLGLRGADIAPLLADRRVYEYIGDYELAVLEGMVRTSTVVYRHERFPDARFPADIRFSEDLYFWLTVGRRARRVAVSAECESASGRGVNLYASAARRTTAQVRVFSDEIEFFKRCLVIPDLGRPARERSIAILSQLRRSLGEELRYHGLRGRLRLVGRELRRDPLLLFRLAPDPARAAGRIRSRTIRALRRRVPDKRRPS